MALSITNQTLTISLIEGAVTTVIRKDNLKVQAFGDVVRLTDYSGVIYEFLYTDCTSPSEASANALRDAINVFLITATGGGGGGSVNSVNAGINISVTGTATDPIINSLSDRYKTTSTTSNSVSNGSKSFTIGTNLSYIPLQEILIVYDVANHMHGEVTSYNSSTGALVVDVKHHTGSGTYTAWVLNLDGTPVDALTGTGTANEIAYFTAGRVLASLPVATYPSLTELSYVKGVTSAIQTQINGKFNNPTGTTSQYIRGDGSLAAFPSILLGGGKFAWMTELYDHTQGNLNAIEYVASVDKLYIAAGGNNVVIYNATTGQLLSTILLTAALKVKYIASINEIWITSVSVASITRVSPTTNAVLGTITTGVVANGIDILEYSATKVFVTINTNPARILEVNPITFLVTSITLNVPVFASGMVLNTNVLSSQFDKIILTAQNGVAILNPTTSIITTTLTNPSSSINSGRDIIYSSSDDKYYVASQVNHSLICLNIDSATTFSVNRIKYNCYQIISFANDEDNDLLIINQTAAIGGNLNTMCNFIKRSTFDSMTNVNTPAVGGANVQSGYLKLDVLNKRVFVAGRSTGSRNVVTVKYL
jgi:hypothetical protein